MVCESEGAVAGCVFYVREPSFLYIGRLAVLPHYRRQGIGGTLLRAVERRAVDLGLSRVRLGVRRPLDRLRAYYLSRGYVAIGLETHQGYKEPTVVKMEKTVVDRSSG